MAFGIRVRHRDHWENSGWGLYLVDRKKDAEFLVWTSPYIVRAAKDFSKDIITVQTLLARHSLSGSKKLEDNDFVYGGWDMQDHLRDEDLVIDRSNRGVGWKIADRSYSYKKGRWRIVGTHAGVYTNLHLTPLGEPIWYVGPPMDPLRKGQGWYWVFAEVNGDISLDGESYDVQGMGIHERHIIHGARFDLVKETRDQGFTWFVGLGQGFTFLLSNFRGRGKEFYFLSKDRVFEAFDKEVTAVTSAQWVDPRSRFSAPCRWHLTVNAKKVYMDAHVSGYVRAYYPWTFMRNSNNVLYFFLSSLRGRYRLESEGWRTTEFSSKDRCYVHTNWSFHKRSS